jgi:hypothetical protein
MRNALVTLALLASACGTTTAQQSDLATGGADLAVAPDLAQPPDLTPPTLYTVFIRGTLKNDLPTSKNIHDQIVANGKATAMMLGDTAHYVYLNVPPPSDGGTPPSNQVLVIDRWTSLEGFMKFASDPNVMAAFAMCSSRQSTIGSRSRARWRSMEIRTSRPASPRCSQGRPPWSLMSIVTGRSIEVTSHSGADPPVNSATRIVKGLQ